MTKNFNSDIKLKLGKIDQVYHLYHTKEIQASIQRYKKKAKVSVIFNPQKETQPHEILQQTFIIQ